MDEYQQLQNAVDRVRALRLDQLTVGDMLKIQEIVTAYMSGEGLWSSTCVGYIATLKDILRRVEAK